jgi:hemolysin III
MHLVCFFLAIPAGIAVIAVAQAGRGRVGAIVYAVGLVALFGVSGFYHRLRWTDARRRLMQKLDHGTIFVMIAGSYTPMCLIAMKGWASWAMLAVAWAGATIGFVVAVTGAGRLARIVRGTLYIALGWAAVVAVPSMWSTLSIAELVLIAVGGVLYTVGAVFLLTRWPDPFPRVFGYHEVWHALVVAAVACHFVAITSVVS